MIPTLPPMFNLPKPIAGPTLAPTAYQEVQNPQISYASQANGLTAPQDTVEIGRAQVLQTSSRLNEAWRATLTGGTAAPGAAPLYTQIQGEHVRINHPSMAPLARVSGGRVEGDPGVTSAFVTTENIHDMAEGAMGRPLRYRTGDGKLEVNLNNGSPMDGPHHMPGTGTINLPVVNGLNAADDPDLVAHEQGHAILDAQRPDLSRSNPSTRAMHEAFGDATAYFASLRNPDVRADTLRNWGQGNASTLATNVAEGATAAVNPAALPTAAIRNLADAPPTAADNQLPDSHEAARKFGSAMPHIVRSVYDDLRQRNPNLTPDQALQQAAQQVGGDFFRSPDFLGASPEQSQNDLAAAMMRANSVDGQGGRNEMYRRHFESAGLRPVTTDTTVRQAGLAALGQQVRLPEGLAAAPGFDAVAGDKPNDSSRLAAEFLRQHGSTLGVPSSYNLTPQQVYRNDRGEVFMQFSGGPSAPGNENPLAPMGAGTEHLRVGFNRQGELIQADSAHLDPPRFTPLPGGMPPFPAPFPAPTGPGGTWPPTGTPTFIPGGQGPTFVPGTTWPPVGGPGSLPPWQPPVGMPTTAPAGGHAH